MSSRRLHEYEVVAHTRVGTERVHPYATEDPLEPGRVLRLEGRYWLVESVEPEESPTRAVAEPARYRMELHHPDGRVEAGSFRRYRAGAPGLGHSLTTIEDGQPASWQVTTARLARDEEGEPYLELIAERDFGELEQLPDHELEHALEARHQPPEGASALLSRAAEEGLSVELVSLEPGEAPDWNEAGSYIDALILEEIEDDLLELCGVDPRRDPQERWLEIVKERLRADLESFRADVEGDLDEIERWDFLDGEIFAAVGRMDDESDPNSGYGWLCRLVDVSALAAAGFHRVRRAELELAE